MAVSSEATEPRNFQEAWNYPIPKDRVKWLEAIKLEFKGNKENKFGRLLMEMIMRKEKTLLDANGFLSRKEMEFTEHD